MIKPTGEEVDLDSLPTQTFLEPEGLVTRHVVAHGDVIRMELWVCTTQIPDGVETFQGRVEFTAGQGNVESVNPRWYSEDRLALEANHQAHVSTFFQAVPDDVPGQPSETGVKFHLMPWIKWGEEDAQKFEATGNIERFVISDEVDGKLSHSPGPIGAKDCDPQPPGSVHAYDRIHTEIGNVHINPGHPEDLANYSTVPGGTIIVGSVRACTTRLDLDMRTVRLAVKFLPLETGAGLDLDLSPGDSIPSNPVSVDATGALIVAPWEDAPFNRQDLNTDPSGAGPSAQNTLFYQYAPKVKGVYELIPRVMGVLPPQYEPEIFRPDGRVLAEGTAAGNPATDDAFIFCVKVNPCTLPHDGGP